MVDDPGSARDSARYRYRSLRRRPSADGVALLVIEVEDPEGEMRDIGIPMWPSDLKRIAIAAVTALEPEEKEIRDAD